MVFFNEIFPLELTRYFEITKYQILCCMSLNQEYWLIEMDERNEVPDGYTASDYETKDFMRPTDVNDFPIRGKGVVLRLRKRRWRHKETKSIIKRDFTFLADSSKFTRELSDFLKGTN